MKTLHRQYGFTLIEILVVISIIALLVAILIPTLSRSREQARLMLCQTQIHGLATAFHLYATANQGQLPGNLNDPDVDWLGTSNYSSPRHGRQPEDGTLFKGYMGRERKAYLCPGDSPQPRAGRFFSYSAILVLSGAPIEMPNGAHYRSEPDPLDWQNYSERDHRAHMKRMQGVPLMVEEDELRSYATNVDGGWGNTDSVTDRHLVTNGRGWGNIGCLDTSVVRVQLSPSKSRNGPGLFFHAGSICIQRGKSWIPAKDGVYGSFHDAISAESLGVPHQ